MAFNLEAMTSNLQKRERKREYFAHSNTICKRIIINGGDGVLSDASALVSPIRLVWKWSNPLIPTTQYDACDACVLRWGKGPRLNQNASKCYQFAKEGVGGIFCSISFRSFGTNENFSRPPSELAFVTISHAHAEFDTSVFGFQCAWAPG